MLDTYGTLRARAHQGLRASLKGIARSVAFAIGIALSIGCTPLHEGSIDAIKPKAYIRLYLNESQSNCLIKLYSKESAFNASAVGNLKGKYHTYGIPQIKNPMIGTLTANKQIDYGIKYIEHRYKGDTCKAYAHFIRHGWH